MRSCWWRDRYFRRHGLHPEADQPSPKRLPGAAAVPVLDRVPPAGHRHRRGGHAPGGLPAMGQASAGRAARRCVPTSRRSSSACAWTNSAQRALDARSTSDPGCPSRCCQRSRRPDRPVVMRESLSFAFLLMLEKLSPLERAVFVLRAVFDYDYSEIAPIVGKSRSELPAGLPSSAPAHGRPSRRSFSPPARPAARAPHRTVFPRAANTGDVAGFVRLLADDVMAIGDRRWRQSGRRLAATPRT